MADLVDGQILEVLATDKGSRADIAAWAETVGHRYIGTTEEDAVLKHYIRKCENDTIVEKAFEPTIELVEVVGKKMGLS